MASAVPKVTLNNGLSLPILGLGTWMADRGEVYDAVKHAIDVGYRHFDCAYFYDNEVEVGKAIREKITAGTVKREDVFITSKLWCNAMRPDMVEPTLRKSLDNFGLEYLDLYLIHWPTAFEAGEETYPKKDNGNPNFATTFDYVDTWKSLEAVYKKGLTKSIGISNFNTKQVKRLLENAQVIPVVNQVEFHPYLNQKALLSLCKANNIQIVAYAPLGSNQRPWATASDPKILEEAKVKAIAEKHKKTPAQIILRYLIQLGLVPIPKSTNNKRIEENINVFDIELSSEDIKVLDNFDLHIRYHNHTEVMGHPYYPFVEE